MRRVGNDGVKKAIGTILCGAGGISFVDAVFCAIDDDWRTGFLMLTSSVALAVTGVVVNYWGER